MAVPMPPSPPDYDKIIEEELVRIRDYSWIQNNRKRIELEKENPLYKNPAHNNAMVESFEASVKSRLLTAKESYFYELDDYQRKLQQYLKKIEEELSEKQKMAEETKNEFETAKKFYDDFQSLVHEKFKYIHTTVSKVLDSQKEESE